MAGLYDCPEPIEARLLVAFVELVGYARVAPTHSPETGFAILRDYAGWLHGRLTPAGGALVRWSGDSSLWVFPEDRTDDAVLALLACRHEGEAWLMARGCECTVSIRAHLGPVVRGLLHLGEERRLEVCGPVVQTTVQMRAHGLAVTPQVFRKLSPASRQLFKKHTPPITYIPVEERHRD